MPVCGMRLPGEQVGIDGAIFVLPHHQGMVMLAVDLIFCSPTIAKISILKTQSRVYTDALGQSVCSAPLVPAIRAQCAPEVYSIAAITGHSSGGKDIGCAAHAPAVTCITAVARCVCPPEVNEANATASSFSAHVCCRMVIGGQDGQLPHPNLGSCAGPCALQ